MGLADDSLIALEAARARVRAQVAEARAAATDAARMSKDVRNATATSTSVGREVSVTARAGGSVDRIEIAPAGLDLDAGTLSRIVTQTVRAAQRAAADAALMRMAQDVGRDSALVTTTREQIDAQFGATGRER